MTDDTPTRGAPTLASLISTIARLLVSGGGLSRGDVSALRRMDPRTPAAAFFKVAGLVLDELMPAEPGHRADAETRWAAITAGLAYLEALHRPGQRLGRVLADTGWSEHRFVRLVRADTDRLADDLPALARFLVAKGIPVDWTAAADLILSAGTERSEEVRRHLARDYYRVMSREQTA
jgi:CRISPR type I-E-associated protein CasB/Cse2